MELKYKASKRNFVWIWICRFTLQSSTMMIIL